MIQIWSFRGHPILYRSKAAARHEADVAGGEKLISYTLHGQGREVSEKDFFKAVDTGKGPVMDLFLQGIPFVRTEHSLMGEMYIVNDDASDMLQTYLTNPKRRRNPVSGEWWIIDGSAHYADGDVGDMNHEAYVVDHLAGIFLNAMDIEARDERTGPMSEYEDQIVRWLADEKEIPREEAQEDPADMACKILFKRMVPKRFKTKEQYDQAFFIAWGSKTNIRAADYSIRYDGWKRVQNNWIETWTFTKDDLKSIIDGLYDANQDQLSPEDAFNVEVRATKTEYNGVPLSVLESGDYSAIREYATKHNPRRKMKKNPRVAVFGSLPSARNYAKQAFMATEQPQAIVHAEFTSGRPLLGSGKNTHEVMSFADYALIPQQKQGLVIEVVGAQTQAEATASTRQYRAVRV